MPERPPLATIIEGGVNILQQVVVRNSPALTLPAQAAQIAMAMRATATCALPFLNHVPLRHRRLRSCVLRRTQAVGRAVRIDVNTDGLS
jgi:hypothetical protein